MTSRPAAAGLPGLMSRAAAHTASPPVAGASWVALDLLELVADTLHADSQERDRFADLHTDYLQVMAVRDDWTYHDHPESPYPAAGALLRRYLDRWAGTRMPAAA